MFTNATDFMTWINEVKEADNCIGCMILFIFQELRKVAKDSTVTTNLYNNYTNGKIAQIKITAYELGYNG